jgi:hypothetical protein
MAHWFPQVLSKTIVCETAWVFPSLGGLSSLLKPQSQVVLFGSLVIKCHHNVA